VPLKQVRALVTVSGVQETDAASARLPKLTSVDSTLRRILHPEKCSALECTELGNDSLPLITTALDWPRLMGNNHQP
jgi:hypothetical protein